MHKTGQRVDRVWAIATVATVLLALCIPLVVDGRYYFRGDTQAAYYGWWFHIGQELRDGHLPFLDAQAWRAGNITAEGQWGIYNPGVWLLGLLATVVPSVLVFATAVKWAVACFGALGGYVLARSYGAHPAAAYVAAVASCLGGVSVFLEWPSWLAGLTIWSIVPWTWWAIRRTARRGANPLPALLFTYLLVTTGYVYGTVMLLVVLAALVAESIAARSGVRAVLGIGVVGALITVVVYLPGYLTMDWTIRAGTEAYPRDDVLTTTPLSILTSFLPSAGTDGGFEQQTAWRYLGWFLPLLLLVRWQSALRAWRQLLAPVVAMGLTFLLVNGVGVVGPLRWPMRLAPFLVQFLAVLLAVLLTRHRAPVSRPRLVMMVYSVVAAMAWFVVRDGLAAELLVSGAVTAVAVVAVAQVMHRPGIAAAVAAAACLVMLSLQLAWFPEPPADQRNLPTSLDGYRTQLNTAAGDVLVVGQQDNRTIEDPALASEVLAGSTWYLTGHPVQNTYTTISYQDYYDRYCIRIHGQTCSEVLDTLFSSEPLTGRLRVDLLSVSTLLLIKADVGSPPVPQGWHVSEETPRTVTWVRDRPLPTAGGPVWSSPGTGVSVLAQSDRSLTLRVASVPRSGGTIVLSRLAWPGYSTSYGGFARPTDGYLLTLSLPASAAGQEVTVRFDPPGWQLELTCLVLAVVGGLAWVLRSSLGRATGTPSVDPGRTEVPASRQ